MNEQFINYVKKNQLRCYFIIGSIIGVCCFLIIYGYRVIDVTYDSWILETNSDLTQHYLGWKYFRKSDFTIPIGLIDGLLPEKVSIIYTDSIPIFAILFKTISFLLPETFQYFGVWGILCFALQGGFAAVIFKKYISNPIVIVIASIIICINPIVLQRMFLHTALAGHWVILAAIFICIYNDMFKNYKTKIVICCILACLTVSIHMYYIPMIFGILFFHFIYQVMMGKKWTKELLLIIIPIIMALFTMLLLGAFYGNIDVVEGGFGYFSANLNALFNPQGTSIILDSLPFFGGQDEGYSYLGLGVIILLCLGIIGFFAKHKKIKFGKVEKISVFLWCIFIIVFFIYSISNRITWGDKVLINLPLPNKLLSIFNIFRVSARFMWPIVYSFVFISIILVARLYKKYISIILIVICMMIQLVDISNFISSKQERFMKYVDYSARLDSEVWEYIAEGKKGIEYITFEDEKEMEYEGNLWDIFTTYNIFRLTEYAEEHDMVLNDFYMGRKNKKNLKEEKLNALLKIKDKKAEDDLIYVFHKIPLNLTDRTNLNFYQIDNLIIGITDKIPEEYGNETNCEKIELDKITTYSVLPNNNQHLQFGYDTGNGRIINKEGISYGPYISLSKGSYIVQITGKNLNHGQYTVTYNKGEEQIPIEEFVVQEDFVQYRIHLYEDLTNVEFVIQNKLVEEILIEDIKLNIQKQ